MKSIKSLAIVFILFFAMTSISVAQLPVQDNEDEALKLISSTPLENPVIIGLGEQQVTGDNFSAFQQAYSYIFNHTYPTSTEFLLYPESFTFESQGGQQTQFPRGAIIKLTEDGLWDTFNFIKTRTTIDLGRAKALYDGNIAILDVEKVIDGKNRHLTYESDAYCEALHTYIGKHERCFRGFSDFETYLGDNNFPDKESTSVIFMHPEDIQAGNLLMGDQPFFELLILPDLTFGFAEEILAELGTDGAAAIVAYVQAGGTVFAAGKASYLAQELGLLAPGTVDPNIVVRNRQNLGFLNFLPNTDFDSRLSGLGLLAETGGGIGSYFLSSFLTQAANDPELIEIAQFDLASENFYFQNPVSLLEIPKTAQAMTGLGVKPFGNGTVLIHTGHPASGNQKFFPFVFNAVFDAMAKNIIANLKVIQTASQEVPENVIPALESGVGLLGKLEIQNFFDEKITDIIIHINIAQGFMADISGLSNCQLVTPESSAYSQTIECTIAEIGAFDKTSLEFPITITDALVTRAGSGILAASGNVVYNTAAGNTERVDTGPRYLIAYRGAEIRGEYNPDPSSFYPLKGEGVFIDNVLTAENKENTNALEVTHIAVVPLVSPVVDGNDQASLTYTIEFYDDYYQSHSLRDANTYVFPFESTDPRDKDFIDYKTLKCTDSILSADWDTPVKVSLMSRSDAGLPAATDCPDNTINDVIGKDYAFSVPNENQAAQQRYFSDADDYYEHATQRQLVFLDTTREKGALSYYGGTIPTDLQNGTVAKKNLIFARNDIYFYDNANYPLPEGVSDDPSAELYGPDIFFTIDKFLDAGDAEGIVNAGFFDDDQADGVKANEYENKLMHKLGKTPMDIADIETKTNGEIRVSHYLFPIDDVDQIDSASDLAHFDPGTGEYETYPDVKFITAHTADFTLEQSTTPLGGRFTFTLPDGGPVFGTADPVADDLISFTADHIAVRNIAYDDTAKSITVNFLRGRLPDQTNGKPDTLRLNLENLTGAPASFSVAVTLESLRYDLGDPDEMAKYDPVESFPTDLTLDTKPFLRLPCLIMKFRLHRGDAKDESYFQSYEYFEPFVRYGVYIQELLKHRTVYAYTENHPVSDPGLVVKSGGFSTFSNIGSSSIPFREYLQTGARQIIPSAPQTSRVDYQDIWRRQWTTPIRTVLPDVPPIPPPLRNFMINTTFEVRDTATGERQLEWNSRHPAEVLLKIKLLNNYPKYFEPTVSKDNEFLLRGAGDDAAPNLKEKQYIDPDPLHYMDSGDADYPAENLYLSRANSSKYGECYQTEGDMAGGETLTAQDRQDILDAQVCLEDDSCIVTGIPTVSRRPDGQTGNWNFSHAVENYFPDNYIDESMWSLTHYDYADDAFAKGYPYHLDNLLPNLDNVRKGILRPHNIIAQPMFKGLGFALDYDREYTSKFFTVDGEKITGWRSDNLQNKDDTLLGGQQASNAISVDKTDLMAGLWKELSELDDVGNYRDSALKNIYACLFNRWRATVDPENGKIIYPPNVYRNNVIPIIPDLDKNDPDLTGYACSDTYYTPDTIHSVDNIVETDAKDWLYFGAGLRGGAKETINVVAKLNPISGVRFEGFAKINEGARFVYWNPANGPNSFIVLDNEVNVIEALQSRIWLSKEIIPVEVPTFFADIYHLVTVADWDESARQFTESPFLKHYGFADATTSIQVGTAQNLEARGSILEPGDQTTIKIELFNNSGVDWNLIKSADDIMAIESVELDPMAINANDLLNETKHAIREPTAFNFLNFDVPDEIKDYIEIKPATHNIGVAGILFDFENINVTRIRDGFKGSYFVDMTVKSGFPDALQGKTYEIGVSLVEKFFDTFPGHANDTLNHDYVLQIPAIRFGVPYGSDKGSLAGNVYRTSGYSSAVVLMDEYPEGIDPVELKQITWSELQDFRQATQNPETRQQDLLTLFTDTNFGQGYTFEKTAGEDGITRLKIDLDENGISRFPIPQETDPDQNALYLLVRSSAPFLPYGENIVNQNLYADYLDFGANEETANISSPRYRKVRAAGADLTANYSARLVNSATLESLPVQQLNPEGENLIELFLRIENVGSDTAYLPEASIYIPNSVELVQVVDQADYQVSHTSEFQIITFSLSEDIAPGDGNLIRMYLRFINQTEFSFMDLLIPSAFAANGGGVLIVDHVDTSFYLTRGASGSPVTQQTGGEFYLNFAQNPIPTLELNANLMSKGHYRIFVTFKDVPFSDAYYRLFIVYNGETYPVFEGYSADEYIDLTLEYGPVEIYGALYEKGTGVNATGDPVDVYTERGQSIALPLNSFNLIPTINVWGLLLLGAFLMLVTAIIIRRREKGMGSLVD